MNKSYNINILLLLFTALLTLTTACSEDSSQIRPDVVEESVEAAFSLNVPEEFIQTRAMSENGEHKISSVDILVFRKDGLGNEQFFYSQQATLVDGSGSIKKYRASVKKSDDKQQFVVFANSRKLINSAQFNETMSRKEVLELIEIKQEGAWNVSSNFDPFPMWGETDYMLVENSSPELSVDMLRSVARIDINLSTEALSQFKLKSVIFENAPNVGRIAPEDENWNALTERVVAPSEPVGGFATTATKQEYVVADGKSLERTIYSLEHSKSSSNSDLNAPHLLLKGSWNGEEDSYYRVDFFNEERNEFLPILRNYHYNVQIIEVAGSGYPTEKEASERGFSLMTATTHQLSSGDMGSIVWDGRDMLSISATNFKIYSEEQTVNIEIMTTYEEGWEATIELDSDDQKDWLSVVGSNKGDGSKTKGKLELRVKQNSQKNRVATVTISAGRLKQKIEITQELALHLALELSDIELVYSSQSPVEQELRLEWIPAANDCKVELLKDGNNTPLTFSGANKLPTTVSDDGSSATTGVRTLKLKPDAKSLGLFKENRSILRVTAYDANNTPLIEEMTLRQFDYEVSVTNQRESYDCGTTYALNVKSNALWDVVVSDEEMLSITSNVRGQVNYDVGEEITFKTKGKAGEATLKFISREGVFSDRIVTINIESQLPNCYIIAPGTQNFKFSIANAFRVWRQDVDLKDYKYLIEDGVKTVELLWQDEKGLIPQQPKLVGDQIVVSTAQGKEGNAVVVLKVDGVVRWSWHLWVCDFDPNQNTFANTNTGAIVMDRNLGATTNFAPQDNNDVRSFGLHYQHGRKDPFPGSARTTGTATKTIYGIDNAPLTEGSDGLRITPVAVLKNLVNAIANPLTFYTHESSGAVIDEALDWYTNAISAASPLYHRNDLWAVGYKSVYDPCPEGWKVAHQREVWDFIEPPEEQGSIAENKGVNTHFGYYPAAGRRQNNGQFYYVGQGAYFYDCSSSYGGSQFFMNSVTFSSWGGISRAFGYSIRCVKIQ